MKIIKIELNLVESLIAEAGAMRYADGNIRFEFKMGHESQPNKGLFSK